MGMPWKPFGYQGAQALSPVLPRVFQGRPKMKTDRSPSSSDGTLAGRENAIRHAAGGLAEVLAAQAVHLHLVVERPPIQAGVLADAPHVPAVLAQHAADVLCLLYTSDAADDDYTV